VTLTIATGLAAVVTGSAALYAETTHAAADSGNELFLYVALRRSRKPADSKHPLGYGQELYYWALLAAVSMFVAGGVLSLREGLSELIDPEPVGSFFLGYAVLVLGLLLDGVAWLVVLRQSRKEADRMEVSLRRQIRTTTDTTLPAVFLQEAVALIGGVFAIAGLATREITGSAWPDGLAALGIGGLQVFVAIHLARRNRELLSSQTVRSDTRDRIIEVAEAVPGVVAVGPITAFVVGPHRAVAMVEVVTDPALTGVEVHETVDTVAERAEAAFDGNITVHVTPILDPTTEPKPANT
jgi:cation diffusion facilitator family transporter